MITLAQLRAHCRLMPDEIHFDGELQIALDAAKDHIASIGVDMSADPFPPALDQAVLMLATHLWDNKGDLPFSKAPYLPNAIDRLIAPYRSVSL
ncbi:head-tail connector protein [Phaeobacter sp. HF9A]|uniref:head-tail connector protein n=1 Tax=Phaeobacter sp. HF9A TaxID=2721561 RepID=UPI001431D5C8|nr:head-tail connector protein [Phaeobacter sp. HF9A]NIZ13485.1 phage gp6-like head-tail connector protein [Phaeobacter sp. HF9A]